MNSVTKKATKKDLSVISWTKDEYNSLDPKALAEVLEPRVSEGQALDVLVSLVENGTIEIKDPEALMDWTYKAVQVAGIDAEVVKQIPGKVEPKTKLTMAEFETTSAADIANYFRLYTTAGRAARIILALIEQGYKPATEKVVQLTNSRICIEGVSLPKQNKQRSSVLLKGVTVNNGTTA